MYYSFICPKCGAEKTLEMKISEYTPDGHSCPDCKAEMNRDPKSLVCGVSIDQTGDFYRKCN